MGSVVNAFVRGLYDPHLRRKVMNHGGASCRSLWLLYDIVLQTQKAIQEKKLVREQLAERKKLSRLVELCQHLTNQSASSLLSDLDDPTKGIRSIMSQAATVSSSRPLVLHSYLCLRRGLSLKSVHSLFSGLRLLPCIRRSCHP